MALNGVLRQRGLLEAKARDLLLEIAILLAGIAEIDVVGPAMTDVVPETVEEPLEGSDGGNSPIAQKCDVAAVGCARLDGAPNLHGEADSLGKQNRHQHQDIFEPCEERFHALEMIICESACARSWRG